MNEISDINQGKDYDISDKHWSIPSDDWIREFIFIPILIHLGIFNFWDSAQNHEDQTVIHDCHCNEYHTYQDISCQSTKSCNLILDK